MRPGEIRPDIGPEIRPVTRRHALKTAALATTALIAAPYVRGAHAAGRLSIGFWDHWVPGGNNASKALVEEWAAKEKVDVTIDYIPSQGMKNLITIAAESQARSGHDIFAFPSWQPHGHAESLEPVNDIMDELIKQNGAVNETVKYLGFSNGKWLVVPATVGSQIKGPCSRIDLFKNYAGIDLQAMYPAGAPPKADGWTLETFLQAAQACHKGGYPFGIGLGTTSDSVDSAGAFMHAFGAALVDAKGNITVKTDPVRQWLDYYKKLAAFMPPDIPAWDDASNNKWLISGRGALIMNPPSAWAVAKRDNPKVAENCWTHPMPRGPKGRFVGQLPQFYGLWKFSQNKSAAKDLLLHISQRDSVRQLVAASIGYDLPSFKSLYDFETWKTVEPPVGTVYSYPPRGDEVTSIAGAPARSDVGAQIYNQAINTVMVAKFTQGNEKLEDVIKWAERELEGTLRA